MDEIVCAELKAAKTATNAVDPAGIAAVVVCVADDLADAERTVEPRDVGVAMTGFAGIPGPGNGIET